MGEVFVQFVPFILIFGVFYFLLILPQQRHRKKTQEMLDNLKTGDRVVTNGGLYGTIVGFRDVQVIQLQVAPQVKVEVARSAIAALAQGEESKPQEASGGGKK
jgi:preprotein translocase subunit YajC